MAAELLLLLFAVLMSYNSHEPIRLQVHLPFSDCKRNIPLTFGHLKAVAKPLAHSLQGKRASGLALLRLWRDVGARYVMLALHCTVPSTRPSTCFPVPLPRYPSPFLSTYLPLSILSYQIVPSRNKTYHVVFHCIM